MNHRYRTQAILDRQLHPRFRPALAVIMLGAIGLVAPHVAAGAGPNYTPPPGALNPAVTQANIDQTICRSGWTRTVRPPYEYTNDLKHRQIAERHLPGTIHDYQEDHLVPLDLGGAPWDPQNLWPQPWREATVKDQLEIALNQDVCSGAMTLQDAQQCIRVDWVACARRVGMPTP
jgi:hypothetical protein